VWCILTATLWRCSTRKRRRLQSGRLPRAGRVLMTHSLMTRRTSGRPEWTTILHSGLNTQTGEFTEYLLPHETNVRHVEVQKSELSPASGWGTSTAAQSSVSNRWFRNRRWLRYCSGALCRFKWTRPMFVLKCSRGLSLRSLRVRQNSTNAGLKPATTFGQEKWVVAIFQRHARKKPALIEHRYRVVESSAPG